VQEVEGSIPGADKLDSGFYPSNVGKMRSSYYEPVITTEDCGGVKHAAVR